jgi:hypothetical protein
MFEIEDRRAILAAFKNSLVEYLVGTAIFLFETFVYEKLVGHVFVHEADVVAIHRDRSLIDSEAGVNVGLVDGVLAEGALDERHIRDIGAKAPSHPESIACMAFTTVKNRLVHTGVAEVEVIGQI